MAKKGYYGSGSISPRQNYKIESVSYSENNKIAITLSEGLELQLETGRTRSGFLEKLAGQKVKLKINSWPPRLINDVYIYYDGCKVYPLPIKRSRKPVEKKDEEII